MKHILLAAGLLTPLGAQVLVEGEVVRWESRRNEVRKPAVGGDTFDLGQLLGPSPVAGGRLALSWDLGRRQGIRFLLAPFEAEGTGTFAQPVRFEGTLFAPGVPTEGLYRFNSWRVTWRYTWVQTPAWTVKVGATAKVRDAKVRMRQGGREATTTDLGLVPLAHAQVERRFSRDLSVLFETDALAAPQGRAVDVAILLRWQLGGRGFVDLGYRMLEGGADNDTLYTWARLDGWRAGAGLRF